MDGALALGLYRTVGAIRSNVSDAPTSRAVAAVSTEGFGVGRAGAAAGADLGGSSKYSNENFED
jgi:hypothetical protein